MCSLISRSLEICVCGEAKPIHVIQFNNNEKNEQKYFDSFRRSKARKSVRKKNCKRVEYLACNLLSLTKVGWFNKRLKLRKTRDFFFCSSGERITSVFFSEGGRYFYIRF